MWYPLGTHVRILRPPGIYHHAIIVGMGGASVGSAPMMVIDNAKWLGVSLRSLDGVAAGDPVQVVEYPQSLEHAAAIVDRAYGMIGSRYALLNWNCENFARWCVMGVSRSYQVERGMVVGALVLGLVLTASNK